MASSVAQEKVYSFKISITGEIFYYCRGKVIDLSEIPEVDRPVFSSADREKADRRTRISQGIHTPAEESSDSSSENDKADPEPSNSQPREVYYADDPEMGRIYLIVRLIASKKELITIKKDLLSQEEIDRAKPAAEFHEMRKKEGNAAKMAQRRAPKKRRETHQETDPEIAGQQVYMGGASQKTYYWVLGREGSGRPYARKVARKRLTDDQIYNSKSYALLDAIIRSYRDEKWGRAQQNAERMQREQAEAERREQEWRKQAETERMRKNAQSTTQGSSRRISQGPAPRARITRDEMRGMMNLLASQRIWSHSDWKKWIAKNHPDKNPTADRDLVARINTAAGTIYPK